MYSKNTVFLFPFINCIFLGGLACNSQGRSFHYTAVLFINVTNHVEDLTCYQYPLVDMGNPPPSGSLI